MHQPSPVHDLVCSCGPTVLESPPEIPGVLPPIYPHKSYRPNQGMIRNTALQNAGMPYCLLTHSKQQA